MNPESDLRFKGTHIIITGAGGNFGREGCVYFALRGARITALDNNLIALQETLRETQSMVQEKGNGNSNSIQIFQCDVTSASSVQQVVDQAVASFGTPHLLWNNAGYQGQIKPTLEYSTDDFATVMNINVTGMFIVLQTVARYMATASTNEYESKHFSIVNTGSVAALRGTPAMVAYSASKAAVLAMTVAAAKGTSIFVEVLRHFNFSISIPFSLLTYAAAIFHVFIHNNKNNINRSCTTWHTCQCH